MTKEQRKGYLNAIELYFSTSKDYKVVERVKKGFFFLQKGERKSCYTEVGSCSHSTFALPYSYKEKPFSAGAAKTNYYAVLFPEEKVLAVGRPKKIRLTIAANPTSVERFTDDNEVEWVWFNKKVLEEAFDKIEKL